MNEFDELNKILRKDMEKSKGNPEYARACLASAGIIDTAAGCLKYPYCNQICTDCKIGRRCEQYSPKVFVTTDGQRILEGMTVFWIWGDKVYRTEVRDYENEIAIMENPGRIVSLRELRVYADPKKMLQDYLTDVELQSGISLQSVKKVCSSVLSLY